MKTENLIIPLKGFTLGPLNFSTDQICSSNHLNSNEGGCVIGVLGRNGSGKTTLFEAMLGLNKYTGSLDMQADYRKISFILDKCPFNLYYSPDAVGKYYGSYYEDFDINLFKGLCLKYNIPLKTSLRKLSKGLVILTQLAFAQSYSSSILILDEATAHMDVFGKETLYEHVSSFTNNGGQVWWATHILSELDKMADFVLGLKNGRQIFFDSKENIKDKYLRISDSKDKLDLFKNHIIGRRDGEIGSYAIIESSKKPAFLSCDGRATLDDIVEFIL